MIPTYTRTKSDRADDYEPRNGQLHTWAISWTEQIARAAGGLPAGGHADVYMILHEIERRLRVGDYRPAVIEPTPKEMELL